MIIYKTTNKVNGHFYIGKDQKNNPDYLGSGIALQRAILKYGRENFSKEILEECNDKKVLADRERYWISQYNATKDENSYNIAEGGFGGNTGAYHKVGRKGELNGMYGKKHSPESIQKAKEKRAKWLASEEGVKHRIMHSKLWKNNNPGKNKSDITRKKISDSRKGQPASHYSKYILTTPLGETIEIITKNNLIAWCNDFGHSLWTIERRLLAGITPKSGSLVGWTAIALKIPGGHL